MSDACTLDGKCYMLQNSFIREKQMLAYEICRVVDGRLRPYLAKVDKTNGAKLLRALPSAMTHRSAERTAALQLGARTSRGYMQEAHRRGGRRSSAASDAR